MSRLGDKLQPIAFLPSMKGYVSRALEESIECLKLIKDAKINPGTVAVIRKSAIAHIEGAYHYRAQLNDWRNSMVASHYVEAIRSIEDDLEQLKKLNKEILTKSSCMT